MSATDVRPVVSRASWLTLVAMTGSLAMIMLDQTVVTVALPTMARDLSLAPAPSSGWSTPTCSPWRPRSLSAASSAASSVR